MADEVRNPVRGDGYAAAHLDAMGEGYGFRKVRRVLDVTAFGINAIVLPAGIETGFHYHDVQEETYFVHRGRLEFEFGDGRKLVLGPGGFVRVDASTHRKVRNVGDEDAIYVVVGGKDGYVGREAHVPEGDSRIRG
ncbi:MAG: cupin domain-containing protein [Solirubrobacteraceae bacterium]